MTPDAADWVYDVVLTDAYRESCTIEGDPRLIRTCRCQHGRCGHCGAGKHEKCTTRVHGPMSGPETYVITRSGGARTPVLLGGWSCAWRCSCVCPEPDLRGQGELVAATGRVAKRSAAPDSHHHGELFGQLDLFDIAGGPR